METLLYDLGEQTSLSNTDDPVVPLRFSHEEVDDFMYSLRRIDVSRLTKDNKICEICHLCFDEWRWGHQHPANAGVSEPCKVLEDMIPENSVRPPCGHNFGKFCLPTWKMEIPKSHPHARNAERH